MVNEFAFGGCVRFPPAELERRLNVPICYLPFPRPSPRQMSVAVSKGFLNQRDTACLRLSLLESRASSSISPAYLKD